MENLCLNYQGFFLVFLIRILLKFLCNSSMLALLITISANDSCFISVDERKKMELIGNFTNKCQNNHVSTLTDIY